VSGRRVLAWVMGHRSLLAAGMIGAVVVSIGVLVARRPEPPRLLVQQAATRPAVSPQVTSLVVIHLSGEVIAPGIYRLPAGARIDDALKAAGGPTSEGDVHRINLAARLADGQQIVVPKRIDPVFAALAAASPSPAPGRVNVNMASVPELDRLPGVGPVTAQRIVAYREQHGPFSNIEQLRDAKLVNGATFEKIKELIGI
jgi:competence protein ComEA